MRTLAAFLIGWTKLKRCHLISRFTMGMCYAWIKSWLVYFLNVSTDVKDKSHIGQRCATWRNQLQLNQRRYWAEVATAIIEFHFSCILPSINIIDHLSVIHHWWYHLITPRMTVLIQTVVGFEHLMNVRSDTDLNTSSSRLVSNYYVKASNSD